MRRILLFLSMITFAATACGGLEEAVQDGISEASEVAADARQQIEDTSQNVRFCTAALEVAQAAENQNWDRAIESGENLVETAPEEIAAEAQTVLDGARAYRDGDQQAVQSEEFRQAADRLDSFTRETCDPRS